MNTPELPKAKDQVLAWVRSKNPHTMELKFGCFFKVKKKTPFEVLGCDEGEYMVPYDLSFDEDHLDPILELNRALSVYRERGANGLVSNYETAHMELFENWKELMDNGNIEILGSDMGLQELMIALSYGDYFCSTDGWIQEHEGYGDTVSYAKYDLTKNLHNQTEDFYESILPLIPNA